MPDFFHSLSARFGLSNAGLGTAIAIFAVSFVGSLALVTILIVRMPADAFAKERPPRNLLSSVLRNLLGIALVLVGIVLSVPGVPGQGILTILVGLMLTDLPGVRRLERAIVRRPAVRRALDAIRRRFGKEPLRVE